jgi:biopolymer transport protein ExbB
MNVLSQAAAYWESGGPLLIPIAVSSLGIWAYYLRARRRLVLALRESAGLEDALSRSAEARARGKGPGPAESPRGFVADAIGDALRDIRQGDRPVEALERREEEAMERLRGDLILLAAFTAAAPLLGLLGTVTGMIATFGAVAETSGETSTRVASGISEALITTQFGLVVAIPGVFGLSHLRRLLDRLRNRFAQCRSRLLLELERRA